MCERWICEHHVGNEPLARPTVSAGHVVAYNPEVVDRDMRELRTTSAFANCPDAAGGRLQALVHLDEAACVERDPGSIKADSSRVGDAANSDKEVAALN